MVPNIKMSKLTEVSNLTPDPSSSSPSPGAQLLPQHSELHYQLKTQDCLTHIWTRPQLKLVESDHHNGQRFFNYLPRPKESSRWDLVKWLAARKQFTWQDDFEREQQEFFTSKWAKPEDRPHAYLDDWQIWFVSHATILIQMGPYNFLTDPVWAEYISPRHGRGPKRVMPAGIALEELPRIHAVLLSHNHYDHMDLATLNWLHQKFAMPIYTGLGNAHYLPKSMHVIEMDWWQSALFNGLKIVYTPAQHGSGRGLRDQNAALWGGFSILSEHGHCFFAGDTGYSGHFKEIQKRLGAPRIALLPIGAYEPRAILGFLHMNPQDALHAHVDLQAKRSLAIHYRTFQLTDEARDEPEKLLHDLLQQSSKLINPFYCIREGKKLIV